MKSRSHASVYRHKTTVLFISLFFLLLIRCSNPVKEPLKNLIGHWMAEGGQRHFYFSREKRLVVTDENKEVLADVEYNIGVVEDTTGNMTRKSIKLVFSYRIFRTDECWFTFSEDKKRINSTVFGILNYVDGKQGP